MLYEELRVASLCRKGRVGVDVNTHVLRLARKWKVQLKYEPVGRRRRQMNLRAPPCWLARESQEAPTMPLGPTIPLAVYDSPDLARARPTALSPAPDGVVDWRRREGYRAGVPPIGRTAQAS